MPISEGFSALNQTSVLSFHWAPFRWDQELFALLKHGMLLANTLGQHRKAWFVCGNCLLSLHSVLEAPHSEVRLTDTRSQRQCKHLTSGFKNVFKLCPSEKHPKSNTSYSANGGPPLGRRVWAACERGHTLQYTSVPYPTWGCAHAITQALKRETVTTITPSEKDGR